MKKITVLTIMMAFLVTIPGVANAETITPPRNLIVFKIGDYNYYTQFIDKDYGTHKSSPDKFQMDAAPLIKDNRTFVPIRFLGNALGVPDSNINWDATTQTTTLKGKSELQLTIGNKTLTVNNKATNMDVAPMITNGRTMLPARFVAENLGYTVEWDEENKLVVCYPADTYWPNMNKIMQKVNNLPPGVTDLPAWGNLPTIPVEKGVRVSPPEYKTHVYSIGIDVEVPGAVDNGCAILANIMDDPSAGEKAKTIILNAKKDDIWANLVTLSFNGTVA